MALISEATVEIPDTPSVSMESKGDILIIGHGDNTLMAANIVKDHLNVTVIVSGKENILPPKIMEYPIFRGQIESAKGNLGNFKIKIDDYSPAAPASRQLLQFDELGQAGSITSDLILDLRGEKPLFVGEEKCDGYASPDPGNPASINLALLQLSISFP